MKRLILTSIVAALATLCISAQNIAVVAPNGTTNICTTLDEAIEKSNVQTGYVIYLPGGGFTVKDETKITKKVTIIGVSHRLDTDNVDGNTTIGGNLFFEKGSDGSALMGVYVSGNVNIGTSEDSVRNVLIRYCNVNSIQVKHNQCSGLVVNQCYLRNNSNFGNTNSKITNNICQSLDYINGGTINNNVITGNSDHYNYGHYWFAFYGVDNSIITNNVLMEPGSSLHSGGNCHISHNMLHNRVWGENSISISDWNAVFKDPSHGISTASDFTVIGDEGKNAGSDGKDVGIYGGTGFDPNALAPIPRIVSKTIPEQTDASGKLNIQITVKSK